MSAEARHLEVSGIFPNVWIVERTLGMGFIQRAVVEHIVEDHWNAKCADFHDLCGLVLSVKRKTSLFAASAHARVIFNGRSAGNVGVRSAAAKILFVVAEPRLVDAPSRSNSFSNLVSSRAQPQRDVAKMKKPSCERALSRSPGVKSKARHSSVSAPRPFATSEPVSG